MKNYTIIIFGGTGDLAKRKLAPAILSLALKDSGAGFTVLGVGRKDFTSQAYRDFLLSINDIPENLSVHYFRMEIETEKSFDGLNAALESIEPAGTEGRIYYLATSYTMFGRLARAIHLCCKGESAMFTRIIAEKPFGRDLASCRILDRTIKRYFTEEHIYRADHYQAKETIDNILKLRLSNPLFENIWNSKFISRISVVVDEELGVGNRLGYYDNSGAIRDMVQNHLLQTVSMVLMEPPASMEENDFKKAKVDAVKKLCFTGEVITGQYRGYQDEVKNINPGSQTETFAQVKLMSSAKRWKGVGIILRTGKMLAKRKAYIEIEFKKEPCLFYCDLNTAPNKLIMHIQPSSNIELLINATAPGGKASIVPVKMTFCPSCDFEANSPDAYEVILRECINGNRRIFLGDAEISASWKLTDGIMKTVADTVPVIYEPGSKGPII